MKKKPSVIHEAPMHAIGATREAVEAARDAILQIIAHNELDATVLVQALVTYERICGVSNITIRDCNFTSGPKE